MGLKTSSRYPAKFTSGRQISRVSASTRNTFLTVSTNSGRKHLLEKDSSHQAATNRKTSLGEKKMGRLVIVESGMILRKERNFYVKKNH
jgi:hypothetical protein